MKCQGAVQPLPFPRSTRPEGLATAVLSMPTYGVGDSQAHLYVQGGAQSSHRYCVIGSHLGCEPSPTHSPSARAEGGMGRGEHSFMATDVLPLPSVLCTKWLLNMPFWGNPLPCQLQSLSLRERGSLAPETKSHGFHGSCPASPVITSLSAPVEAKD